MTPERRDALTDGERAGSRYRLRLPHDPAAGGGGFQRGRQAGASLDFKDYREYRPGDDLRHIDWHVYARSDRLTVRLFHEEVNPHADIVLDGSRSMALEQTAKARAALGIGALLAAAASNARCTHYAWLAGRGLERIPNGGEPPSRWEGIGFDFPGDPFNALLAGANWRKGAIRILVSDLLWMGEPLAVLRRLAHGASAVWIVQVLARADLTPPPPGSLQLRDVETDGTLDLFLDEAGRARYLQALARHRDNWERSCRQANAGFVTVEAESLADAWRPVELEAAGMVECR